MLGNIFFTLLARHETVGSTLGFILVLVTLFPKYQRRIQEELDQRFGGRPRSAWTVEKDHQPLQKGYIGAIQKEVLFLYNPASFIVRRTVEAVTLVDSKGRSHVIPEDSLSLINTGAAARNPAIWTKPEVTPERRAALSDSPAPYFNPERWLGTNDRPDDVKGTLPIWRAFGAGGRACPGRMFAQIEMTSAMATLFKEYSLELIVSEKTFRECQGDEILAWERTRDVGIKMMYDDIEANISIGLMKELPIRVIKRMHLAIS